MKKLFLICIVIMAPCMMHAAEPYSAKATKGKLARKPTEKAEVTRSKTGSRRRGRSRSPKLVLTAKQLEWQRWHRRMEKCFEIGHYTEPDPTDVDTLTLLSGEPNLAYELYDFDLPELAAPADADSSDGEIFSRSDDEHEKENIATHPNLIASPVNALVSAALSATAAAGAGSACAKLHDSKEG